MNDETPKQDILTKPKKKRNFYRRSSNASANKSIHRESIVNDNNLSLLIEHPIIEKVEDVKDDNTKPCQSVINLINLLKGYILTMLFALCACISNILMKKSFTLSGSDSAFIRYLVQFLTMIIIANYQKRNPLGPKSERKLLTYRGLAGITGLLCGFFAIKFINPSDFKAINHSSIIITAILARIFLKEKLTIAHIFALILTIIGVILISKPSFIFSFIIKNNEIHLNSSILNLTNSSLLNNSNSLFLNFTNSSLIESISNSTSSKFILSQNSYFITIGVLFSLGAAFGGGSARVILKKLCTNNVHFSIATVYASYYGLPVSLIISIILTATGLTHKDIKNELKFLPEHLAWTVFASCIGVIGQIFLNIALKYEDASRLAIMKTIDVFYAFLLQYLFLNITPDLFSVVGALTILSGAFLILMFKVIESQRKKHHRPSLAQLKLRRTSFGH